MNGRLGRDRERVENYDIDGRKKKTTLKLLLQKGNGKLNKF